MIRYILLFILMSCVHCYAQTSNDIQKIKKDSVSITVRQFDADLEKKYNTEDFNYTRKEGEAQNLLSRFVNWVFEVLYDTFGIRISPGMQYILKIIIYSSIGIVIIYLLLRFLAIENINSLFSRKSASVSAFHFQEEDIAQVDFRKRIAEALSTRDYRLATRYLYLLSLQELSSHHLITWHFEKTNQEYYSELTSPEIQSVFKDLCYLFDHVWYGEFPIDAVSFDYIEKRFKTLHQRIKKQLG